MKNFIFFFFNRIKIQFCFYKVINHLRPFSSFFFLYRTKSLESISQDSIILSYRDEIYRHQQAYIYIIDCLLFVLSRVVKRAREREKPLVITCSHVYSGSFTKNNSKMTFCKVGIHAWVNIIIDHVFFRSMKI